MSSFPNWEAFRQEYPSFVDVYGNLLKAIPVLMLDPRSRGEGIANKVVFELVLAAVQDADDILLLCSQDRPWGGLKLLRCLFERTITLKFLVQNPARIADFVEYDAVDRSAILDGIEKTIGYRAPPGKTEWLDNASAAVRAKLKQERCPACHKNQTSWTKRSSEQLAKETGLDHLHFEAFIRPSKYIHPTYHGIQELGQVTEAPMEETLRAVHILTLEAALAHQKHFRPSPLEAQSMVDAVVGFFKVWTVAPNDFGVGEELLKRTGGSLHGVGLLRKPTGTP